MGVWPGPGDSQCLQREPGKRAPHKQGRNTPASPGACPSQVWHPADSYWSWRTPWAALIGERRGRGEARRGGASRLRPGLKCGCGHRDYVAGTPPPATRSFPGGGFCARCNYRGSGSARVERVARAAGARHGVSGIRYRAGRRGRGGSYDDTWVGPESLTGSRAVRDSGAGTVWSPGVGTWTRKLGLVRGFWEF